VTTWIRIYLGCTLLGLSVACQSVMAQGANQLQELTKAVADRLLPAERLPPNLVDCSTTDVALLESQPGAKGGRSQWIYNGSYSWQTLQVGGGICVFLRQPEHRGLTVAEARTLLSASRLEFPVDPAELAKQQAYSDGAIALRSFGGNPSEESAKINGHPYRIRYMGVGPELAQLDSEQRKFATQEKDALARREPSRLSTSAADSTPELDIEFSSGGRTKELAVVVANGHRVGADGAVERIHADWMLYIPNGRIVTFDDLFADPQLARQNFSEAFRKGSGAHNDMYIVALGDPKKQAEFNDAYYAASVQASSPIPEHFVHLMIGTVDPSKPTLLIDFTEQDLMPNVHEFPHIQMWSEYFRDLLKPEYRTAFDGVPDTQ
jgi:hypothetical protein